MRRKRKITVGAKRRRRKIVVKGPPDTETRMKLVTPGDYAEAKKQPFARMIVHCSVRQGRSRDTSERLVPALACYIHSQGLALKPEALDHPYYLDHCLGCTRWLDAVEKLLRGRRRRKIVLEGGDKHVARRKKIQA